MKKPSLNANLIKKYHQDLVFNYAEYPTCDHWDYNFNSEDYKKALVDWIPKNPNKKIFFYVHIPFVKNFAGFVLVVKLLIKIMQKLQTIYYTFTKRLIYYLII